MPQQGYVGIAEVDMVALVDMVAAVAVVNPEEI